MKNSASRDQRDEFQRAESGLRFLRHAHIGLLLPSLPHLLSTSNYILTFLCQSAEGFSPERAQEGRKERPRWDPLPHWVDKLPSTAQNSASSFWECGGEFPRPSLLPESRDPPLPGLHQAGPSLAAHLGCRIDSFGSFLLGISI